MGKTSLPSVNWLLMAYVNVAIHLEPRGWSINCMSHSIGIPEFGVEIGKIVVPILGDFQKDFIIC